MSDYHDSYEEEEQAQKNRCQRQSFIIIEQSPISFFDWFRGRRALSSHEITRISEDFSDLGIKAIILPPGCHFGD